MERSTVPASEYARVNGLTEDQVLDFVRDGKLEGELREDQWHVFPSPPSSLQAKEARNPLIKYAKIACLLLFLGLLLAFNPDEERHGAAIQENLMSRMAARTPAPKNAFELMGLQLEASMAMMPVLSQVRYNNYGVFSTTSLEGKTLTFGMLGVVLTVGKI